MKIEKNTLDKITEIQNRANYLHDVVVNQKYGENDVLPYSYHLESVVDCAMEYLNMITSNEEDIIPIMFGAAFHDSIEDARLTYNDVMKIAKEYMSDEKALIATEIVYALTNEKGRNRAERADERYYAGIRNTQYAPYIKMCDRIANMNYSKKVGSSMYKKYMNELPSFLEHITNTDKRDGYNIPMEMLIDIQKL